jgi:hypothetical protein
MSRKENLYEFKPEYLEEYEPCKHEWHTAVEPNGWPTIENGWYVACKRCGKWAIQQSVWVDDFEKPVGEPVVLTPR